MGRVYEEIVDFLATGPTSAQLAGFHPSPEASQRVADLIEREKSGLLSPDETDELDGYVQLEHVMRLAKARARLQLSARTAAVP